MELQTDFAYNSLNLLEKAVRNDTIVAKYSYLADGTKLSVTDVGENGLYYLGSLVYEKHANTIGLESAGFSSGRIVATAGNDTEIRYFLTDHLESVRVDRPEQRPRTQRLLSFRKTLGLCIAANFGQPRPVQRQGGSGVRRLAVLGLRRSNVRPRKRTVALAGSAGG